MVELRGPTTHPVGGLPRDAAFFVRAPGRSYRPCCPAIRSIIWLCSWAGCPKPKDCPASQHFCQPPGQIGRGRENL